VEVKGVSSEVGQKMEEDACRWRAGHRQWESLVIQHLHVRFRLFPTSHETYRDE